jgi:hypothetical protein
VQRSRDILFTGSYGHDRAFVGILGGIAGQENPRSRLDFLGSSSDQDAVAEGSEGAGECLPE